MPGCRSPSPMASGSWLFDAQGRRYLDALAGIAVSTRSAMATRGWCAAIADAGRAPDPHLQPLPDARAGTAGRQAGATSPAWTKSSSAIPVARPTKRRSSWRACTATSKGIDSPDHHRHGKGLPRPHAGDAVGHRQPQGAGRLRAAGLRLRARALRRSGGDRAGRGEQPQRGRRAARTDPGRGRHQHRARRLPAGTAPHLRRSRAGC